MADKKKIALTITANTAQLRRDMRRAGQEVKGFERNVMGLGQRLRQMRMRFQSTGIFGRGGGALRTAAGFAGVFGFTQLIDQAKQSNAALTDIAITGNLTDAEVKKLKRTMYEVSNATAKSTSELGSFVATVTTMTGDAKGATEALAGIGEVMVATGASGEALAGTYVKLTTSMGLLPKQAREAFNILRAQEKMGSITMANVAANFGKIVGAGSVFGEEAKGMKGVKTLGGLYQLTQRQFAVGQEGESANAASRFLSNLARRSKQIKKVFGVDVFYKSGKARDLPTVFEELGRAFNVKREAFRTKGQLLFGEKGIRTARQLALEAGRAGGFGVVDPSNYGAFQLMREAGKKDVITADNLKRQQSAAQQFDKQLNILRNALKKHITPLFKDLAAGMEKWGPDIIKIFKFLLENSASLLKLWLGYKGITFFRRFMAPLQGGAGGMAGGGGMAMLPGGQMIPAGDVASLVRGGGRPIGYFTGRDHWRQSGLQGEWVSSGRSGGQYYTGNLAGMQMAGVGPARVSAGGAWTTLGGAGGQRWGRTRAAGRWMGGMATRYGPGAARFGGQIAGVAGMFGAGHQYGSQWAEGAANMALMSNSLPAQAVGGTYKVANELAYLTTRKGKHGGRVDETGWKGTLGKISDYAGGVFTQYTRDKAKEVSIASVLASRQDVRRALIQGSGPTEKAQGLLRGLGMGVGTQEAGGRWSLADDMPYLQSQYGRGGLTAMQSRFAGQAGEERARIVNRMKQLQIEGKGEGGAYTEEQIRSAGGEVYAKLMDFAKELGLVLKNMPSRINVTANVKGGPASRLEDNNPPTQPEPKLIPYNPGQFGMR